jgi:hypothetical protein
VVGQLLIPQVEQPGHQGALSKKNLGRTNRSNGGKNFMATKKKAAKKKKH